MEIAIKLLDELINDRTIPRNIRRVAEQAKLELLNNDKPIDLRVSAAIHLLDEVVNDPNMPLYGRTRIWNIVSILEKIRSKAEK